MLDVYNEIIIFRGCFCDDATRSLIRKDLEAHPERKHLENLMPCVKIIRIPLRLPPGEHPPLHPEDVILQTGDVVFLEAREDQFFYTGGLLPPGAHVLPRDHDLDVLEAVAAIRGPFLNGAFGGSNLSGNLLAPGLGDPSPSLLVVIRRLPGQTQVPIRVDLNRALVDARERILIQPRDVLVLQETPEEAMARYFTETFLNFDLVWKAVHTPFATGVLDVSAPDRLPSRASIVNFNQP